MIVCAVRRMCRHEDLRLLRRADDRSHVPEVGTVSVPDDRPGDYGSASDERPAVGDDRGHDGSVSDERRWVGRSSSQPKLRISNEEFVARYLRLRETVLVTLSEMPPLPIMLRHTGTTA